MRSTRNRLRYCDHGHTDAREGWIGIDRAAKKPAVQNANNIIDRADNRLEIATGKVCATRKFRTEEGISEK